MKRPQLWQVHATAVAIGFVCLVLQMLRPERFTQLRDVFSGRQAVFSIAGMSASILACLALTCLGASLQLVNRSAQRTWINFLARTALVFALGLAGLAPNIAIHEHLYGDLAKDAMYPMFAFFVTILLWNITVAVAMFGRGKGLFEFSQISLPLAASLALLTAGHSMMSALDVIVVLLPLAIGAASDEAADDLLAGCAEVSEDYRSGSRGSIGGGGGGDSYGYSRSAHFDKRVVSYASWD